MNHSVPSAAAYANEPVRFAPLTVVDIGGESAAVSEVYQNPTNARRDSALVRLAQRTSGSHLRSELSPTPE